MKKNPFNIERAERWIEAKACLFSAFFVSGSHKYLTISTDCNITSLCDDGGHIFERNGWIVGVIMVAATF